MSPMLDEQIEGLKRTIAEMDSQRSALGDDVVDAGLTPLQHKLVTLLLMDIAGLTTIAQDMHPEDVGEVLDITLSQQAENSKEQDTSGILLSGCLPGRQPARDEDA